MFWFQIKGDFGKFYEHAASQAEPGYGDHGYNKVFLECWNTLLTMLRVLTGELSGLVEGGRPTKVTLFPNNPPVPGLGSLLRSSALQTSKQNLAQTVISWDENKVDSMVETFFAKLS